MRAALTSICALAVATLVLFTAPAEAGWYGATVLDAVNQARAERRLPLLTWNQTLADAAQAHANDMVRGRYVSHIASDGRELSDRIAAYCRGPGCMVGENIAWGYSAEGVAAAWLESPGHRKTLLNWFYREAGLGAAALPDGRVIVVMEAGFRTEGRPLLVVRDVSNGSVRLGPQDP